MQPSRRLRPPSPEPQQINSPATTAHAVPSSETYTEQANNKKGEWLHQLDREAHADRLPVVALPDVQGRRGHPFLSTQAKGAEYDHSEEVEERPLQGLEDIELHGVDVAHLRNSNATCHNTQQRFKRNREIAPMFAK